MNCKAKKDIYIFDDGKKYKFKKIMHLFRVHTENGDFHYFTNEEFKENFAVEVLSDYWQTDREELPFDEQPREVYEDDIYCDM